MVVSSVAVVYVLVVMMKFVFCPINQGEDDNKKPKLKS